MPTYEYECPAGHEFELIQKMSDKPRVKCPVCGRLATRKISGGAGLVFKGTGFYITDYGKDGKGPRKAEKAEGAGKAEGADKTDANKADKPDSSSKPDSKPEPEPAKPSKSQKKKASE